MYPLTAVTLSLLPVLVVSALTINIVEDKPQHSAVASTKSKLDHVYVACYTDAGAPGRTLAAKELDDGAMSVELCRSTCQNYNYFGVEDGNQCFCGFGINPEANTVPETQCNYQCAGNSNEFCGAFWRIGVYHILNLTESTTPTKEQYRVQYEI